MNGKDISQAKDPDLRGSLAAMQRAAELARQTAIKTNTAIIMVQDGQPVRITADELRKAAKHGETARVLSFPRRRESSL
jgi:hypothetical protein